MLTVDLVVRLPGLAPGYYRLSAKSDFAETEELGSYDVQLHGPGTYYSLGAKVRRARVEGFDRSRGALALQAEALLALEKEVRG